MSDELKDILSNEHPEIDPELMMQYLQGKKLKDGVDAYVEVAAAKAGVAGLTRALARELGMSEREAAEGTVRKLYAESKERNAIHASDSDDNASRESRFFFAESDIL